MARSRSPPKRAGRATASFLSFPFAAPTPAAIFRRAGTLWLVFDHRGEIDLGALSGQSGNFIRYAQGMALPDGHVIRLMLDRPRLVSAINDPAAGGTWTITIGDNITEPTNPLSVTRTTSNSARPAIVVPIDQPRELRRVADPDMGDSLMVVTALGPDARLHPCLWISSNFVRLPPRTALRFSRWPTTFRSNCRPSMS